MEHDENVPPFNREIEDAISLLAYRIRAVTPNCDVGTLIRDLRQAVAEVIL